MRLSEPWRLEANEEKFVFETEQIVRCEGELNFFEMSKMRKKMRAALDCVLHIMIANNVWSFLESRGLLALHPNEVSGARSPFLRIYV